MNESDRPGITVERPEKRKAASSRLADLGDRLARTFAPVDRTGTPAMPWEANTEAHYPVEGNGDGDGMWEDAPAFPIVRNGYDRDAVDEYLNELEREIDELRARPQRDNDVSTEIKRIGEQTAAILQTAHQQAQETTRKAQAEADNCLQDAAANAIAMTDEAKHKLRNLDSETDAVWHERARLIDDIRTVATALFSLAEDATERFPSEEDKRAGAARAAVQPVKVAAAGDAEHDPQASVAGGDDHVGGLDDRGDGSPLLEP